MALNPPLAGVRVLDLSTLLPGPYCSWILAGFGADVLKIERPGGSDWARHAPPTLEGQGALFRCLNRGKKSLTLNLKADAGREVFRRLVARSDVLLETFRPGVMERLGLGYAALREVKPALLYCALSGYGPSGPYRSRAGHDLNYIGLAGLLDLTGQRDSSPVIPGAPIADLTGGLWAAIGILLLLFARSRSGAGAKVNASLLGAALACLPVAVAGEAGGEPVRRGSGELNGGFICYNVYACKDGAYLTLAALEPDFWAAFCQAAGRPDLLASQFAPAVPGEPAYDDLCRLFGSRTRDEWTTALQDSDCCCEPVLDLHSAAESAAVLALRILHDGSLRPPLDFGDGGPGISPPAGELGEKAPDLGADNAAVLSALGFSPAEAEALRQDGVI
jgi:crotonobetainyl-CoA:carnitine CoA-transferase CaiB-like acyl-CoA transferase